MPHSVSHTRQDFFYICPGHLKDTGFCTPKIDQAAIEARKKKELEEEIARVKKEYEEKKKKKEKEKEEKEKKAKEKKDDKDTDKKDDGKSEEEKKDKDAEVCFDHISIFHSLSNDIIAN